MARRTRKGFNLGTLVDFASQAFAELQESPDGMPRRIFDEIGPWMASFTQTAAVKWLPFLADAHSCKVPVLRSGVDFPCTNHAIGPCDACGRPTCIHHAMVDQHGGVACYLCVAEIMRLKRRMPPIADSADRRPPVPDEVAKMRVKRALALLGLPADASWEVIRKRHRKLLADNHPDKQRTPADKAAAEKRYKEFGEAYLDLERFHKKGQAA